MHSRPSHPSQGHRKLLQCAIAAGGLLLLAALAWRSLRMPEPRPRRDGPPSTPAPSLNY